MSRRRFPVRAFCVAAAAALLIWPGESLAQRTSVARGQWIDITGVSDGEYILRIRTNTGLYSSIFDEGETRYSNTVWTRISIPSPRKKVPVVE